MKVTTSVKQGAEYLCTKLGDAVTAIQQVAMVKGLPMWEVERQIGGIRKRLIVSARTLVPLPAASPGS